ncbi:MAG: HAD-IIIC family phosphatase, partial [Verrucomicrobia bacterium]|nr:HAD-IIIC family phosphatase [Verrucomicrobiota bacterium]
MARLEGVFAALEEEVSGRLAGLGGTVVGAGEWVCRAETVEFRDPRREELAGIPYQPFFFVRMATVIARRLNARANRACKAIVLDCDQTLWGGVCAEAQPSELVLDQPRLGLQRFLLEQRAKGALLCLASKNQAEDVLRVFEARTEMPVRLEHITARRINWKPKSDSLRELAGELGLSLADMVLVDDNPLEIAEVRANCREVVALELPKDPAHLQAYLENVWLFDREAVTGEDRLRADYYRQNTEREQLRRTMTLGEFIQSLDLRIQIEPVDTASLPRVAQLARRTNQFNCVPNRWNESELGAFLGRDGGHGWTVSVADRFGDYGMVGALLCEERGAEATVEAFLLSCRALGRGVEHRMVAHMGQWAGSRGLATIRLRLVPTGRNLPARQFLERVGEGFQVESSEVGSVWVLPAGVAAAVRHNPDAESGPHEPPVADRQSNGEAGQLAPADGADPAVWDQIARLLSTKPVVEIEDLRAMLGRSAPPVDSPAGGQPSQASAVPAGVGAPATLSELRGIVIEAIEAVRRQKTWEGDATISFDRWWLDSLSAVEVLVRLEKRFGRLPRGLLFEHPSVDSVARFLLDRNRAGLSTGTSQNREEGTSARLSGTPAEPERDGIAIIGMAGRFPGAANVDELWDLLRRGADATADIPEDRWDTERFFLAGAKAKGKTYLNRGGFLADVDCFDAGFFNIAPLDAEQMDPQQRLFLETIWHLFEDAGYPPRGFCRETGVYAGIMGSAYQVLTAEAALDGRSAASWSDPYQIANRVSYFFDLRGPSLTIDTACSSSGTALHLACEDLRRGQCQAAVVGGINLLLHPSRFVHYANMGIFSRGGVCRPFGEGADGTVMGEAVAALLLKPLRKAVADGDRIHGILRGSWINSGGRSNGFTVPNPASQAELVRTALCRADVDARTVSYLEAHGTGTALGDPLEVQGLVEAFRTFTPDRGFCALGSIKSNLGHTEAAAGLVGVIKVLLQFKHGLLVPTLHAEQPNPAIDFAATPFMLQQRLEEWRRPVLGGEAGGACPRRAGVSTFGAGGANAHLVIEEPPADRSPPLPPTESPQLLVLSAKSEERLRALADLVLAKLSAEAGLTLAEVAFGLQTGREALPTRAAVWVTNRAQALA